MNPQSEDETIIGQIDDLSFDDLKDYSNQYIVKDLNHYMNVQVSWFEDEKYFLGLHLKQSPSDSQVIDAWIKHHNSERFRAFYILRYPDHVEKTT